MKEHLAGLGKEMQSIELPIKLILSEPTDCLKKGKRNPLKGSATFSHSVAGGL